MTDDEMLARVLHRDGMMFIIDKPAGLPVHAGSGGGDNLELHLDCLRFGLPNPPALAHRLDRDTSGCLVLGRHRKALARLGKLFAGGGVEKTYWAVVQGRPPQDSGRIDLGLTKINQKRGWHMQVDPAGQKSITDYRLMGQGGGLSWLELKPRTGRTHQIRVHCAAIGCPLVGDWVYGTATRAADEVPLHLHARAIVVPLYPNRDPIAVQARVPPHMRDALRKLGFEDADVL